MQYPIKLIPLFAYSAISISAVAADSVDLSRPIPSLRMSDGRVYQQATFSGFRVENVTIRHKAGVAVVVYEALPDAIRAEAEKRRPGGPRYFAGDVAANGATFKGQVFVATRGAGNYKFGATTVYAFPAEALEQWGFNSRPVRLPHPLAETKTDGDGRFTLTVPKDTAFFVFVQARRQIGSQIEQLEWRLPSDKIKKADEVLLDNATVIDGWTRVAIDPKP